MSTPNFPNKQDHIKNLEKFDINQKKALFTIILSILLDVFGYSMVLPLLPGIALDFGATNFMVGLLMASNALAALIFIPVWGKLSDKYGRKSLLVIAQAGTCVSFLILGLSNSFYVILIARIVDGFFGGQIPIIRAYITDITTPQTRARYMGKIMIGFTGGMTLGPLVGGFLGYINWRIPPFLASALTIVLIIMTLKIIVETMPKERRADIKAQKQFTFIMNSNEKESIWNREVISRMFQIFLLSLINFIITSSFPLVLYLRYGVNPFFVGIFMAVGGFSALIYGAVLMTPMLKKIGEKRLLITTFIVMIITSLFYPFLYEFWMVFIFILPFAFCLAYMRPLITTNMTKAVGLDKQGELSGWSTNFQSVSQIFGPLIATSFLDIGGVTIGNIFLNAYSLIGVTIVLLAIILFIVGYLDIRFHPKLYYYEKLRKKRQAMKKKRIKSKPTIAERI